MRVPGAVNRKVTKTQSAVGAHLGFFPWPGDRCAGFSVSRIAGFPTRRARERRGAKRRCGRRRSGGRGKGHRRWRGGHMPPRWSRAGSFGRAHGTRENVAVPPRGPTSQPGDFTHRNAARSSGPLCRRLANGETGERRGPAGWETRAPADRPRQARGMRSAGRRTFRCRSDSASRLAHSRRFANFRSRRPSATASGVRRLAAAFPGTQKLRVGKTRAMADREARRGAGAVHPAASPRGPTLRPVGAGFPPGDARRAVPRKAHLRWDAIPGSKGSSEP